MALALQPDHAVAFQRAHLAADGFQRQAQIIGHLLARQRQIKGHMPRGRAQLQAGIPPRDDRQQRGDLFARRLAAQQQHPFPRRVQLVQRHLQQALRDMRGLDHQLFKGLLAETTHHQIGRRRHVIGGRLPPRTAHEIGGQQQAHHLAAAVLHGLGQGRNAGHHRGDKIHPVA